MSLLLFGLLLELQLKFGCAVAAILLPINLRTLEMRSLVTLSRKLILFVHFNLNVRGKNYKGSRVFFTHFLKIKVSFAPWVETSLSVHKWRGRRHCTNVNIGAATLKWIAATSVVVVAHFISSATTPDGGWKQQQNIGGNGGRLRSGKVVVASLYIRLSSEAVDPILSSSSSADTNKVDGRNN